MSLEHQNRQHSERKHQALTFCKFLLQTLITAKEIILCEEFCKRAVMPDFNISGNRYLSPNETNISNSTKNSSILC